MTLHLPLSNSGSILVSFLILLPPLILGLFAILLFSGVSEIKKSKHHTCRQEVLRLNAQKADAVNKVIEMNKVARKLRTQRRIAEKTYKAAKISKSPHAIAAAAALLAVTKAEQMAFRSLQQLHISRSKIEGQSLKSKVYATFKNQNIHIRKFDAKILLPIYKKGEDTGSPTYHAFKNAEQASKSQILWRFDSPHYLKFIYKKLGIKDRTIHGGCGSAISQRGSQWKSELRMVKP